MKLDKIGEFGLIDRIARKPKNKNIVVGIGDDAAVIKTKGLQVLTTDCMVEGDHFKREWFSALQIGMKAIEINVSDVAAMGAIPKYVLVSLVLPRKIDAEFVDEMYKGMWKTCYKYNCEIIGGNMAHGDKIAISITLIGEMKGKKPCLRSGAAPGDLIFVTGYVGNGRAGLKLYQEGMENLKYFNDVKKGYLEPKAHLKEALKNAPFANSMIDISDGIAPEIRHICKESRCGAIIYKENIPIKDEVRKLAKKLGEDEYDYALFGGEDFELLFTVRKKNLAKISGYLIGEITKDKRVRISSNGKERKLTEKGYDHFSNV